MSEERFEIAGSNGPIRGEILAPADPKGTVVICHGFKGFSHWGFFPHLAQQISAASLTAISFDFSGSGIGPDRENFTEGEKFSVNTLGKELDDLDRVLAHARSRKLIAKKFGLFGHSRGGGIAILYSASDSDVAALVTWNSIGHMHHWAPEEATAWRKRGYTEITNSRTGQVLKLGTALLDEVESLGSTKLNIEAAASKVRAPWLILHGKRDETVEPKNAEALHAASKAHSTLRIIEGNHGFDAKHPMTDVPPALKAATSETVSFFVQQLARDDE